MQLKEQHRDWSMIEKLAYLIALKIIMSMEFHPAGNFYGVEV